MLHQQLQIRHLFRARGFFKDNTKTLFVVTHVTVVFTKTEFSERSEEFIRNGREGNAELIYST